MRLKRTAVARPVAIALSVVALASCRAGDASTRSRQVAVPAVHDDRLQLELFASDPDIVTPIGIAVDERDRVYVLESHTHLPRSDYRGPGGDRVKVFTGPGEERQPGSVRIFADGIDDGMNLAFSPAGELYVVTARAVWALHDRDGDGVSEGRTKVVDMVRPEQVYDHAALLGITFSPDGWMYVSRGNTGGQGWTLRGTDGSTVSGYGDGGNIVRARPDGSRLSEVATGFWNPFDLKFDARGRLLAADNDPDSRGPNRLVHVIPGGDYGYQSLYGGSGIHPYLAWNGELPGTLPYAAPLGEAPTGILDASRSSLPPDYRGDLLATIWEESTISRVRLVPLGTSLAGEAEVLVEGGADFRPVAFATDSRGNVYFTDWVLRAYPNHGRGRVWRLSTKPGVEQMRPRFAFAPPEPDRGRDALEALESATEVEDFDGLLEALRSTDPFVRTAAMRALERPVFRPRVLQATEHGDSEVRLGALLTLKRAKHEEGLPIARKLLRDPHPEVRRMALVWIGSAGMLALREELEQAITVGSATPELFETYIATLEQLSPEFVRSYRGETERYSSNLERSLPPGFLPSLVEDEDRPARLRVIALRHLDRVGPRADLLVRLARRADAPTLRLEAIRSLAALNDTAGATAMREIANDPSAPPEIRAEALLGLARQGVDATADALVLLAAADPDVRLEAARYLRTRTLSEEARESISRLLGTLRADGADEALRAQLAMLLGRSDPSRPTSVEEWNAVAAGGGSPERGRRVFFSVQAACSQCHVADERGGNLGPALTGVGRSKSREQLVRSIVRPSEQVTPEWQGWYVTTANGETHYGRQIDVGEDAIDLYTTAGRFVTFRNVEEYGAVDRSLMPDGLERQLTVPDFRDLIAFLRAMP